MRCPMEVRQELLLNYSAGRGDASAAASFEQHARGCAACGRILASQREVLEALDRWEAPPVSADFDRRLYRRIEQEVPWWNFLVRPFRPVFSNRVVPIAVAAALVVIAGVWIERPGTPPLPAPSAETQALRPDQAEHVLQQMEVVQELSNLVRTDSADPIL
jgi:hypothetical protein